MCAADLGRAMARTFELSVHVAAVSRSDAGGNRSATAAAAYRACCEIACERTGAMHDYRRKQGHEATETIVPRKAGAWAKASRGALWNAAEMAERNGKRGKNAGQFKANARTARDCMFSYPVELSAAGRLNVARIVAGHVVEAHGIGAQFSIHHPGRKGDQRNFHCHMLMTTRTVTAKGMGAKARAWDDQKTGPKLVTELRAFIASTINAELTAEGKAELVHVEHRSFASRGLPQKPQVHQGPSRMHMHRKHQAQAQAKWRQVQQAAQRDRQAKELAALKVRQDFGLQARHGQWTERQRSGEAAIWHELERQRQADQARQERGLRGVFRIITGRAGREAFERQTREAERVIAANEKLTVFRRALREEQTAYVSGQVRDRMQLIERHGLEDRQLQEAFVSRESLDQSRERMWQREERRERGIGQDRQGQDWGRSVGRELNW